MRIETAVHKKLILSWKRAWNDVISIRYTIGSLCSAILWLTFPPFSLLLFANPTAPPPKPVSQHDPLGPVTPPLKTETEKLFGYEAPPKQPTTHPPTLVGLITGHPPYALFEMNGASWIGTPGTSAHGVKTIEVTSEHVIIEQFGTRHTLPK